MSLNMLLDKLREKLRLMGDPWVWLIVIFLCLISVLEVYSASSRDTFGQADFWDPAIRHASFIISGFILIWLISRIPYMLWRYLFPVILFASFVMLIYLAAGGGITLNGGTRWIEILGIRFQPSEIAKVSLVGTIAMMLAGYRDKETRQATPNTSILVAVITICCCGLIFKENISTAGIIACVALMMCWIGRAYLKYLAPITLGLFVLAGSAFFALKVTSSETIHQLDEAIGSERLETAQHRLFGNEEEPADPHEYKVDDYNRQKIHARIAVSSGGIIGKGPGRSVQRDYLPMAFSDFIYAIILEEGGIVAGVFVLGLYILLLFRTIRIAGRCRNLFPAYLIMGLALMLVFQALVNMSVAVGAFPVTGQPLPLVSKGGTSTFMTCLYFGIILSVSHTAKQKAGENQCSTVSAPSN